MFVTKQIQNKLQRKKINLHQRSILREMMNTCDKLGNSFLTRVQEKNFEKKEKQENQLTGKTNIIEKQPHLKRFSHNPFRCAKDNTTEEFVYVKESKQIKQIKDLKQKMLPKVNKTNIQKKLKELTYIRNMGYRSKNKKMDSFKTFNREKDDQNILNRSWQEFYQDKLFSSPTQTPQEKEEIIRNFERKRTKKQTYPIKKEQPDETDKVQKMINSLSETLNTFVDTPRSKFKKQSSQMGKISQIDYDRTNHTSNASSGLFSTIQKNDSNSHHNRMSEVTDQEGLSVAPTEIKQRQTRISTRNKTIFKDIVKSLPRNMKKEVEVENPHYVLQMLSTDRKKDITQKMGLSKEKLQKQNAFNLYSLIKGGYELDRNDVEGEFISLKRFREAKDNFKMLNNCFNKVRQYRYISQEPQRIFNDGSFKSLVYLSEVENKIPQSVYRKVQELNRVVN